MDINNIRTEKDVLEASILNKVNDFEEKCKCSINHISLGFDDCVIDAPKGSPTQDVEYHSLERTIQIDIII